MRWSVVALLALLACSSDDQAPSPDAEDDRDEQLDEDPRDASMRDAARPLDAGRTPDASRPPRDDASSSGDDDPDDAPADAGTEDARPPVDVSGFDWAPGDYPPDLMAQTYLELTDVEGQTGPRGFKVHVPQSYDRTRPMPMLFALHGLGQNAVMFVVQGTSFMELSEREGFILVMPNGFDGSWNAGVCCGTAASQRLDDVAFVRAVYAEVARHLNVDRARVYATGLSNGGFMTHRIACEAADLFTAVAPLAGSIGTAALGAIGTNPTPDLEACEPSQPISVLAMHGDADPIVPYAGMKPSLDHWAEQGGCDTSTEPAAVPTSGGDTTCVSYTGCQDGIEITGCTVQAGGHCWFGNASCGTGAPGIGNLIVGNDSNFLDASEAAWAFLSRLSR